MEVMSIGCANHRHSL